MKRYLCLLAVAICCSVNSKAAPGDTTWVQANINQLSGYGAYDSTVTFPTTGTYRNIYMIFTLGKYVCPGSPTYCGDWDYTVQNFLMTPGGDTLELGRLITPYANAGAPRTPWPWKQRYVFDVTDYVSKLNGTGTIRIFYSGYSGGFTADVKFAFVEGTPDRNVTEIKRLWHGSFGYGGTPDINSHFPALTMTPPAGTASTTLKFTVTGHGADANGCCEFLSKNYDVKLNGTTIATKAIWKACGSNELYPQSGTWVYDRGNWCPGEITYSHFYELPGVATAAYNTNIQFQAYTGGGSYTTEATIINYGPFNKALDAGIEQVIAPTNDENFFRENPACGTPTIRVKNRGATTIDSIRFEYGLKDSVQMQSIWVGSLAPKSEVDIVLAELPNLNTVAGTAGTFTFQAKIVTVNGVADADATNDLMRSDFVSSPAWPNKLVILLKANNEAATPGGTTSETKWELLDWNNNVFASRTTAALDGFYRDTIALPAGCFKLVVTDGGCNGLQWWANPSGTTAGYVKVRNMTNANLALNGYPTGTYDSDFGCGFTQQFYVKTPNAIVDLAKIGASIEVYPNPAQDIVNIDISGIQHVSGTIQVIDAMGRVVSASKCSGTHHQVNIQQLSNGVYTVLFVDENGSKLQTRLLVTK
jgi:hypothetical protein